MIAVRIEPAVEKRLDRLAKKTGRTKTYYVREAILAHLDELEAEQRQAKVASPRVSRLRETPPIALAEGKKAEFMARLKKIYGGRVTPDSKPILDEMRAERF